MDNKESELDRNTSTQQVQDVENVSRDMLRLQVQKMKKKKIQQGGQKRAQISKLPEEKQPNVEKYQDFYVRYANRKKFIKTESWKLSESGQSSESISLRILQTEQGIKRPHPAGDSIEPYYEQFGAGDVMECSMRLVQSPISFCLPQSGKQTQTPCFKIQLRFQSSGTAEWGCYVKVQAYFLNQQDFNKFDEWLPSSSWNQDKEELEGEHTAVQFSVKENEEDKWYEYEFNFVSLVLMKSTGMEIRFLVFVCWIWEDVLAIRYLVPTIVTSRRSDQFVDALNQLKNRDSFPEENRELADSLVPKQPTIQPLKKQAPKGQARSRKPKRRNCKGKQAGKKKPDYCDKNLIQNQIALFVQKYEELQFQRHFEIQNLGLFQRITNFNEWIQSTILLLRGVQVLWDLQCPQFILDIGCKFANYEHLLCEEGDFVLRFGVSTSGLVATTFKYVNLQYLDITQKSAQDEITPIQDNFKHAQHIILLSSQDVQDTSTDLLQLCVDRIKKVPQLKNFVKKDGAKMTVESLEQDIELFKQFQNQDLFPNSHVDQMLLSDTGDGGVQDFLNGRFIDQSVVLNPLDISAAAAMENRFQNNFLQNNNNNKFVQFQYQFCWNVPQQSLPNIFSDCVDVTSQNQVPPLFHSSLELQEQNENQSIIPSLNWSSGEKTQNQQLGQQIPDDQWIDRNILAHDTDLVDGMELVGDDNLHLPIMPPSLGFIPSPPHHPTNFGSYTVSKSSQNNSQNFSSNSGSTSSQNQTLQNNNQNFCSQSLQQNQNYVDSLLNQNTQQIKNNQSQNQDGIQNILNDDNFIDPFQGHFSHRNILPQVSHTDTGNINANNQLFYDFEGINSQNFVGLNSRNIQFGGLNIQSQNFSGLNNFQLQNNGTIQLSNNNFAMYPYYTSVVDKPIFEEQLTRKFQENNKNMSSQQIFCEDEQEEKDDFSDILMQIDPLQTEDDDYVEQQQEVAAAAAAVDEDDEILEMLQGDSNLVNLQHNFLSALDCDPRLLLNQQSQIQNQQQ